MKNIHLILIAIGLFCAPDLAFSQGPVLDWAKRVGGATFHDRGEDIHYDQRGGVLVSGTFYGTVDFDPGIGTFNLTSSGSDDIFIQKLDTAGNFIWARKVGGGDLDRFSHLTTDTAGNVYVTGSFRSTADFDPGAGTYSLTSNGIYDVFILKLDVAGNFVWARSIGGLNSEVANRVKVDIQGNVFIGGQYSQTVDFDPGPGVHNVGSFFTDAFLLKLNGSGDFLWVRTVNGFNSEIIKDFTLDPLENIYVTGSFSGTVDFDQTTNNIGDRTAVGAEDGFILKLNSSGTFVWVQSFGGISADGGERITQDNQNNICLVGIFSDTVDFDPGAGVDQLSATGIYDVVVQKFDQAGNYIWARSFGGTYYDLPTGISCDIANNIYVIGEFWNTVDFDPGPSIQNVTSNGSQDVFIEKLTSSGSFIWVKSLGSSSFDNGEDIEIVADGSIYTTGSFASTTDFDPGSGTFFLTPSGYDDVYELKLHQCMVFGVDTVVACDKYTWIDGVTYRGNNQIATHLLSTSSGCDSLVYLFLTLHPIDSVVEHLVACDSLTWIDGITYYSDNNTVTDTLTNVQGCDSIVFLDLIVHPSRSFTDTIVACASYSWIDGNTYTSSNNSATHLLQSKDGCDSLVSLNLTLFPISQSVDTHVVCDSLIWIDGITYFSSNTTATDTLTNIHGCDSVVYLDLTILPSSQTTDIIIACGNYVWIDGINYSSSNNSATHVLQAMNGCDSIVKLDLTIIPAVYSTDHHMTCDSLLWIDGNTYYTSNNTATDTLVSTYGCDSIVQLDLTVIQIDTSLTVNDPIITSNELGASYRWLDCQNGMTFIPGATGQSFTPVQNGVYAVEITKNGCVDTSSCMAIMRIGMSEKVLDPNMKFYPNPNNGKLIIQGLTGEWISILDVSGKVLKRVKVDSPAFELDLSMLSSGHYQIITDKGYTGKIQILND